LSIPILAGGELAASRARNNASVGCFKLSTAKVCMLVITGGWREHNIRNAFVLHLPEMDTSSCASPFNNNFLTTVNRQGETKDYHALGTHLG